MKAFLLSLLTTLGFSISAHAQPILEGYWESWNSRDSVETITSMHSDVIDISFGTFIRINDSAFVVSGVEASDETVQQLVELAHSQNKKVKLSIGGACYGLSPLLLSEKDASGMAEALRVYVEKFDLDGVDFDIEDYPAAELQVVLIEETRKRLGEEALISYTPKSPASTTPPYTEVIEKSYSNLNAINIMAYDAWSGYRYQEDAEALVNKGVPRDLIVIGLMPGKDDMGTETTLQDIKEAAHWVLERELGGIMFWDLNRDHENLTGLGVDAATTAVWEIFHTG